MKYNVLNRFTGKIQFTADIDCKDDESTSVKLGLSSRWAIKTGADLRGAYLRDADLSGAYLRDADLSGTDLSGAYLRDADLSGTDLRGADLRDADLRGAYLRDADLSGTDLRGTDLRGTDLSDANLRSFKSDLWMILTMAKPEVPNLVKALIDGRVDGSTYTGECCCLVGTLNKGNENFSCALPQSSSSPAEQWFAIIKKGDKPEDGTGGGFASRMALEWINEWQELNNKEVTQ